ncbi:unnamed protein product [Diamesa tonsa]
MGTKRKTMQDDMSRVLPDVSKIKLPEAIVVVDHVSARISELKKIYNDIATTKSEMLLHQMLPNHMRRRAMSHNPKRLPLKYRKIHTNQMLKSGPMTQKRRPSRKYRRKPSNLMQEYTRRSKKNIWLESHIWHAKRYHISDLWGYKIPFAPCDKRYRASYKAASKHCLIQDISYNGAIEISGPFTVLKEHFARMTSQECGLTLTAKCFVSGSREGSADLFKIDSYPHNAIGKVSFIWKPSQNEEDMKSVWIFVHPTAYRELVNEFITLFELVTEPVSVKMETDEADVTVLVEGKKKGTLKKKKKDLKVITEEITFNRNPKHYNQQLKVEIIELKDTLNRFRLTGPLSNAVLSMALRTSNNTTENNWLKELIKEDAVYQEAHTNQELFFNDLHTATSPGELPPYMVLGLNISDPRTNRPEKRTKAIISNKFFKDERNFNSMNSILDIPNCASFSGIWKKNLRDKLTSTAMTTDELCKLRNKCSLVPGQSSAFEKNIQPIPILLIQRPGSQIADFKRLGFGSGWDVIIPAGYGMYVWLNCIMSGAKSGGWREINTIANESGKEVFLPDTVSGIKENDRNRDINKDKYFKRPPNKRTNYKKLGITSPFSCPLSQLVQEWSKQKNTDEFYILRNKMLLNEINEVLCGKKNANNVTIPQNSLIPIYLEIEKRGNPEDFGIICLPTKRDIKTSLVRKYNRDNNPVHLEPLLKDDEEKERKSLRIDHKKLLKRLRNRRIRAKRRLQATSKYRVIIKKSSAEKIIEEQYEKMCELWIPNKPVSVRHQCSRQVFGYLATSRFTFSEAKVFGVGYVTQEGLHELMRVFGKFKGLKPFVLIRSPNNRCYQTATIKVRTEL